MKFGSRLKYLREANNLSQKELSDKLNIGNVTISQYENNVRRPDIATLDLIAKFFNVSTDFLLGRTTDTQLNAKDEKDIEKRIALLREDLANQEELNFLGEDLDEYTRELLIASLENAVRLAKIQAKDKFTPKKYKK